MHVFFQTTVPNCNWSWLLLSCRPYRRSRVSCNKISTSCKCTNKLQLNHSTHTYTYTRTCDHAHTSTHTHTCAHMTSDYTHKNTHVHTHTDFMDNSNFYEPGVSCIRLVCTWVKLCNMQLCNTITYIAIPYLYSCSYMS